MRTSIERRSTAANRAAANHHAGIWIGVRVRRPRAGLLALAAAHHRRCLEDPVLNHPFSHPGNPQHVQRLADYWAEVFGGPHAIRKTSAATQRCSASMPARGPAKISELVSSPASCRQPMMPASLTTPTSAPASARTWSGRSARSSPTRRQRPEWRPACRCLAGAGLAWQALILPDHGRSQADQHLKPDRRPCRSCTNRDRSGLTLSDTNLRIDHIDNTATLHGADEAAKPSMAMAWVD
jgi:hypothetical protein